MAKKEVIEQDDLKPRRESVIYPLLKSTFIINKIKYIIDKIWWGGIDNPQCHYKFGRFPVCKYEFSTVSEPKKYYEMGAIDFLKRYNEIATDIVCPDLFDSPSRVVSSYKVK